MVLPQKGPVTKMKSAAIAILCFLLQACVAEQTRPESGLVSIRYKGYESNGVAVDSSTILSAAHTLQDRSINSQLICINGATSTSTIVLADGWEHHRQVPSHDLSTVHSHAVYTDFLLLQTDLPLTETAFAIPKNLAEAIFSADEIFLITREKATHRELWLETRGVVYDIGHNVIGFSTKKPSSDLYYLSGSPLVALHRNGSRYLLGIVSASAAVTINDGLRPNTLLVCPIDVVPFQGDVR